MKRALMSLVLLGIAAGCASHHQPSQVDRYPNQVRDRNRDGIPDARRPGDARPGRQADDYPPRLDDRRYGDSNDYRRDRYDRNDRYDHRPGPGPGRMGRRWEARQGYRYRCVGCFDRTRYSHAVELGSPVSLMFDQSMGVRDYETFHISNGCGIRSISLEVQNNEAHIASVEVRYRGSYNWDPIPVKLDRDFRYETDEGDRSMWFDVGHPNITDSVCIERIRVRGYTLKDHWTDCGSAQVQFYGSRTRVGADVGGVTPHVAAPIILDQKTVELAPAISCINSIPTQTKPDDMHGNGVFYNGGALGSYCGNARDKSPLRHFQNRGYVCTETCAGNTVGCLNPHADLLTPVGQQAPGCLQTIESKIVRQENIKNSHRQWFVRYCSGQLWTCTKTGY